MTTYRYSLTLNDTEVIAMQEALSRYAEICEAELSNGPKAPFWAHLQAIRSVLYRLTENAQLTSTSHFPPS